MCHLISLVWVRSIDSAQICTFSQRLTLTHPLDVRSDLLYSPVRLFDVSNINPDGTIMDSGSKREIMLRCNRQFHADSAFNPRRGGISLLLAHELPPAETGGDTEFADSRQAYEDLPQETKERIADYVVNNSQFQCRRSANPGNPMVEGPEVSDFQGSNLV